MARKEPTEELANLEVAAHKADQEVRDIHDRVTTRLSRIAQLRSEQLRLATEAPKEFNEDGKPKAGTDAEKILAEVEAVRGADYAIILDAAEERARQARRAVAEHQRDHAVALAEALRPDAEAAIQDLTAALEAVVRATDSYFDVGRRAAAILGPIQGLDGQDLPRGDGIAQLRKVAGRALGETFALPLPRSLVHQPEFPGRKVQVAGGWVNPANVTADEVIA